MAAGVAAVAVAGLAACTSSSSSSAPAGAASPGAGSGSSSSAGTPVRGGDLVVARSTDVTTLDPLAAVETDTIYSLDTIFETLLYPSADGKSTVPGLALSATPSADHLSWTVKLRTGVTFSNGTPMTSADVKFSLDRARVSKEGLGYLLAPITKVTAPDAATVVLTTAHPVANLPALLTLWSGEILPDNSAGMTEKACVQKPIGTGPFVLKSWSPSGDMKVVRNPHYREAGKPYLDSITWRPVTDDNARVTQLQGNAIQVAQELPFSALTTLKSAGGVAVGTFESLLQQFLMMNTKYAPFADPDVRLAVKYAIDSATVTKTATFGYGKATCTVLPPSMPFYSAVDCPNKDDAKAKAALAKSKYPNGFSAKLLIPAATAEASTVAQLAAAQLAQVGIKVKIVTVDSSQLYATQSKGDFQMIYQGWSSDIPDPDEQMSFMLDPNGGGDSYSTYYDNPKIVQLLAAARQEFDTTTRAADYKQVEQLNATDGPFVPLDFEPFADGWSNKVHGFNQLSTGATLYQNVWLSR